MNSNIRIEKQCQVCGKNFIAKTTKTLNCSDPCAKKAYKLRKKYGENFLHHTPFPSSKKETTPTLPLEEIQIKQFLSIKEASALIGASRWTIDRLIKNEKLKVTRIGRKIIIQRTELDKIFTS